MMEAVNMDLCAAVGCASHQESFSRALLVATIMSAGMPGFTQVRLTIRVQILEHFL